MGSRNARLALTTWGHLGKRAPQLLSWMALSSLDRDEAPWYGRGWEDAALGLGRFVPPKPADDDPRAAEVHRERAAAKRAVSLTIAELVSAGAIRKTRRGQPGQLARYELLLTPGMGDTSAPPNGGTPSSTDSSAERQDPSTIRWSRDLPDGGAGISSMVEHVSPPQDEDDHQDVGGRITPGVSSHSAGARASEDEHDPVDPRDYSGRLAARLGGGTR